MRLLRYGFAQMFLIALSLHGQTAPAEASTPRQTFQSKVRAVLVDVVVSDSKGEPVSSLKQTDFTISENGKPQTIASFEEHKAVPLTVTKLPPMPAGVFTNFPTVATADSVNVLLVDTLNTPTRDQVYARTQTIRFLKTLPPGARIAIFTLSSQLRLLQEFTTDSSLLLAALNDKSISGPQASPLVQSEVEVEAIAQMVGSVESAPTKIPATLEEEAVSPAAALRALVADMKVMVTQARVEITLQAMQHLGRFLSSFPGRKNLIWVSGSFPINFLPDPTLPDPFAVTRLFQADIEKTANILTAAQVAVYPVAAEGLLAEQSYQASSQNIGIGSYGRFQGYSGGVDDWLRITSRQTMDMLARDTGGQAFYNTNGIDDVLNRVTQHGMRYYTLSYTPSKQSGNTFRRISVDMPNQKYKLSYRRGYYAIDIGAPSRDKKSEDKETSKAIADPLLPFMGFAEPDLSQVIYKIRVAPSKPQPAPDAPRAGSNVAMKGPITRYDVEFAVAIDDFIFDVSADGTRHGKLELRLVAYDSAGQPVNLLGHKTPITLSPKLYSELQKVGLQIREQIDVPSRGEIHLRTGIYDLNSGNAGTLSVRMSHVDSQPGAGK